MSGYTYHTNDGFKLRIRREDNEDARVGVIWPNGVSTGITLPASERQAAAQALAGDLYEVVPVSAVNAASILDPADVKVGDVVEVEADDGSWLVRGEVKIVEALNPHDNQPFCLSCGYMSTWPDLTTAAVRLVRRAEPEPDPEQVKALAEVMRSLPPISYDSNEDYARDLVRRGVTVRKEH